jgi:predicted aldo/keto reductase-like oxidoreductase
MRVDRDKIFVLLSRVSDITELYELQELLMELEDKDMIEVDQQIVDMVQAKAEEIEERERVKQWH